MSSITSPRGPLTPPVTFSASSSTEGNNEIKFLALIQDLKVIHDDWGLNRRLKPRDEVPAWELKMGQALSSSQTPYGNSAALSSLAPSDTFRLAALLARFKSYFSDDFYTKMLENLPEEAKRLCENFVQIELNTELHNTSTGPFKGRLSFFKDVYGESPMKIFATACFINTSSTSLKDIVNSGVLSKEELKLLGSDLEYCDMTYLDPENPGFEVDLLKSFPNLRFLEITNTLIEELPNTTSYSAIFCSGCTALQKLPHSLPNMIILDISGCPIKTLPQDMVNLENLHADESGIKELPTSMQHLRTLSVDFCPNLGNIPGYMPKIKHLNTIGCPLIELSEQQKTIPRGPLMPGELIVQKDFESNPKRYLLMLGDFLLNNKKFPAIIYYFGGNATFSMKQSDNMEKIDNESDLVKHLFWNLFVKPEGKTSLPLMQMRPSESGCWPIDDQESDTAKALQTIGALLAICLKIEPPKKPYNPELIHQMYNQAIACLRGHSTEWPDMKEELYLKIGSCFDSPFFEIIHRFVCTETTAEDELASLSESYPPQCLNAIRIIAEEMKKQMSPELLDEFRGMSGVEIQNRIQGNPSYPNVSSIS